MFTPQRKIWSGWPLSPAQKNDVSGSGPDPKGKSVAFLDSTPPPPVGFLGQNGGTEESPASVVDKISKLKNELFDYQYNMGMLLIEKKEWTTKYEEMKQALQDATDNLKREQAAHLIALTEVEKREESLRKALGVEKQCALDLEKSLRAMHSQYAEIKFTADSKLAEANALMASIEEKSLEVEAKVHAADAKLAEVSRKSSELERKSREVESRENTIRRERLSFNAEREARESSLAKQREDLRDWENKLKEGEERLDEVRRLLNQREERANETDMIFKQKQNDFEQAQKNIDEANSSLKSKEEDISQRLDNLAEADAMRNSLEVKEKELVALEEKLDARERVEIQKLLDEHKSVLDSKKHEFEMEMEQKRTAFDEDLKNKAVEVEKKEAEVNHLEEKVAKREQAYEKRLDKFKEKEKDFESRSKALKEREKTIKIDEKKLEKERKEMLVDRENMLNLKAELEKIRAEIEEQQSKLKEERERLQLTEEERSEHLHLQSELKLEIDKCRQQRELLLKEGEELKQEREKFEKEWEELDEKRSGINKELEEVIEQKEKIEKTKRLEEERLENEKRATQDYVQRELEALKLAKDSFVASMEHEKAMMDEKIQIEKAQMLNDFELQKRELETEMRKRQEELENSLAEREKSFVDEREREMNNINYLREVARREMEEMKVERLRIEKEKEETAANQKHLAGQQVEMRKDIDDLVHLSRKLKDQREQFFHERERFIEFVERHKDCQTCGEITREFVASDLHQSLPIIDNVEPLSLPGLSDGYLKDGIAVSSHQMLNNEMSPGSGSGTMSWLRKCTTKIFSFSPGKKSEVNGSPNLIESPTDISLREQPIRLLSNENEPESFGIATNSLDGQGVQSGDDQSNINSNAQEIVENSQHSGLKEGKRKPGRRGRPRVNKTHSVKEVVEEAKSILGDAFDQNGSAENSAFFNGEGKPGNRRKRNRAHSSQNTASEQDYSEGHSGSVTAGGGRKRRQKVAQVVQNPGEVRYNLRRARIPVAVATNGALSDLSKGKERNGDDGGGAGDEVSNSKAVVATSTEVASVNGGSAHLLQFETTAGAEDGIVDNMVLSEEEVNGTPERTPVESNGMDNDDDEEEDDEEFEHPGEVSIGKRLLKFLTT
ncbi:hypothetical protein RHSIM_Rhsim08G0079900 [Rhododendron simsii]|uniref:Nuclear matrix constituent protein 1-like protein n=1 Tax=Rhododendron simsii TaxID=118357 RepID=A0A834LDS8_RHOSS|nr:hypothetical protein RHSIM_Rhsim08G0079900 [Rhododendron simsii]